MIDINVANDDDDDEDDGSHLEFKFLVFAELLESLLDDVSDDVGVLAVDVFSSLVSLCKRGVCMSKRRHGGGLHA